MQGSCLRLEIDASILGMFRVLKDALGGKKTSRRNLARGRVSRHLRRSDERHLEGLADMEQRLGQKVQGKPVDPRADAPAPSWSAVRALALAVNAQVSRYCNCYNSFRILAGRIWLYQCLYGCFQYLLVYLLSKSVLPQ